MKRWWTTGVSSFVVSACTVILLVNACDIPGGNPTPTSNPVGFLCSVLSDLCASDADCPSGRCNTTTCNCCPVDSDLCISNADCGANQYCDTATCNCVCGGGGQDPGCNGDPPGGGYCDTFMYDNFGIQTQIPVKGICSQECQCCECLSDNDCNQFTYCNPQTCHCEPRPGCSSSCSGGCSANTACYEVSGGGCACGSYVDVLGCFLSYPTQEMDCVTWQSTPYRLWPGEACQTPNGHAGVCDQNCDCIADCTTGPCRDLEEGDVCPSVGGLYWGNGMPGVCHDCACVCPEGTDCAGGVDGWGCVLSPQVYGTCEMCQCVRECAPGSDGCSSDADCGNIQLFYCNEVCNCVPMPLKICHILSDGCMSNEDCPVQHYCDRICNCHPISPPPPSQPQPPPDDSDLCVSNGGTRSVEEICRCDGFVIKVTTCNDGTKLDQVTDLPCSPDPEACTDLYDKGDIPDDKDKCPCVWSDPCSPSSRCPGYYDCNGKKCTP